MFEAYVTNLGLYPERGVEVGEYLKFPTTTEEVQALFKRIELDGKRYEEYFITDYESDVLGLYDHLGEYESLDELNYLAHLLEEMSPDELEKFEAVMDAGEYTGSVKDLINLTQNLDCYEFSPGIDDEEALGRLYLLDYEAIPIPEYLTDYIDYEAYGRDMRINDGGHFAPGGYVADNRSRFIEHYNGLEDIPEEYCISHVQARDEKEETRSILQTIKEFQEAPPAPHKDKAGFSHEGR
ncbi:antirestriction protein ArdA [Robinsoniella peoriensis]|uniref:antirestriction protein ArdA n=1 Tax=Robinsoniella peoriensis TaxID=180332 RepID=UPI00085C5421|nr:antirestriction protein ArdA [Robinsoniella peoriensis]